MMNKRKWTKLNSLLDAALNLPDDEQAAFIENWSDADPGIKSEAISVLESIQHSAGFWDSLIESNQYLIGSTIHSDNIDRDYTGEKPPAQAGPYNIKELIASGGMGDVYLAERSDGHLQITVALKILRRECTDFLHIQHFKAERNILARLNHANIARIYDGGITYGGRPYLVMEYVDGRPVTTYCEEQELNLKEKLRLFLQICEGVNFAHSKLIVHRDLKPDNIFVSLNGTCKILDFGIAKILTPNQSAPAATNQALNPFSTQYAAPEQLSGEPVTTATDLYALGLLLFELLTGSKPYDLSEKTPHQALEIIQKSNIASECYRADPGRPGIKLPADVISIISRTLHVNPEDRYSSAGALIADIRKYLNMQPISGREDQPFYRLSLYIRRNPGLVGISLTAILTLVISSLLYLSAITAEKQRALENEQQAAFISDFLLDMFEASDPVNNMTDTLNVYDILETGRQNLLNWQASDLAKADVLLSLGTAYKKIGDLEEAGSLMNDAYEISLTHDQSNTNGALLNSVIKLATLHRESRAFNSAAHHYHHALELLNRDESANTTQKVQVLSGYGNTLSELGNPELALLYIGDALELTESLSDNPDIRQSVLSNQAQAYRNNGNYGESEKIYTELLKNTSSDSRKDLNQLGVIHNNLAYLYKEQGRLEMGVLHYSASLNIIRTIYGKHHPTSLMVLNNLAAAYNELGRAEKVEEILRDKLETTIQLYGPSHWQTATSHQALGIFYLQWNNPENSTVHFRDAVELYGEVLGEDHIWTARAALYFTLCRFVETDKSELKNQFYEAYNLLLEKRSFFSQYDISMLNNLISNFKEYPEISETPEFALLQDLR